MKTTFLPALIVLLPLVAAFVSYIIGKLSKNLRDFFVAAFTLFELVLFVGLFYGAMNGTVYGCTIPAFMGIGIGFSVDGFRFIYAVMAMLMWAMCSLASKRYFEHYHNRNRYYFFWLVTLSATVGVFLANDLLTAFLCFEVMSFASYVFVAQEETEAALRAAGTYLAVAVIGGLVALMGIFLLNYYANTLVISEIAAAVAGKPRTGLYISGSLILFGFAAKAGVFPLHIWLPKAHPVAPAPASAVLSGMLTKVGIFGIVVVACRMFAGDKGMGMVLLVLALITMLLGAVLALFSIDLKRTLACSSVSQIGFILTGIAMQQLLGEENTLAVNGTFLHMLNHSLFKLALFLVAGIVMQNLHKLDLNEIRGFGRKKYFLMAVYLCAALGIGGIPLWSGYISKTLLHESIVEGLELYPALKVAEILFLLAGGITVAYMTKLFVALFVEKNLTEEDKMRASDKNYISVGGRIAIGVPAVIICMLGMFPHVFCDKLAAVAAPFFTGREAEIHRVNFFSLENMKGAGISIAVGALLYVFVVRKLLIKKTSEGKIYVNLWPKWLDIEDKIYRPLLLKLLPNVFGAVCSFFGNLFDTVIVKGLVFIGSFFARAFGSGTDSILLGLRKTVYRENPTERRYIGTRATFFFGRCANKLSRFFNKLFRKNKPVTKDYVVIFAENHEINRRKTHLIESSLSFGLLMFCVGLIITMIYLLSR